MKKKIIYNIIASLLLSLLPLSLLSCIFIKNKPYNWWYTISDTYYISPVFPIITILIIVFMLFCFSKNKMENTFLTLIVISLLGIVLFPCSNLYGLIRVGIFNLPDKTSSFFHTFFSVMMITFSFFEIHFVFYPTITNRRVKKLFYLYFSLIVLGSAIFILGKTKIFPKYYELFAELIILIGCSASWFTKSFYLTNDNN